MDRWVDGWLEGGREVGGEGGELKGEMSGLLGGVVIVLLSVCVTKSFPHGGENEEEENNRGRTEGKGEETRQVGEEERR